MIIKSLKFIEKEFLKNALKTFPMLKGNKVHKRVFFYKEMHYLLSILFSVKMIRLNYTHCLTKKNWKLILGRTIIRS